MLEDRGIDLTTSDCPIPYPSCFRQRAPTASSALPSEQRRPVWPPCYSRTTAGPVLAGKDVLNHRSHRPSPLNFAVRYQNPSACRRKPLFNIGVRTASWKSIRLPPRPVPPTTADGISKLAWKLLLAYMDERGTAGFWNLPPRERENFRTWVALLCFTKVLANETIEPSNATRPRYPSLPHYGLLPRRP